jgi:hypothetical protein
MNFKKTLLGLQGTLLVVPLVGCGGGGNGDFVAYVGGNLSGLAPSKILVLRNNVNGREEDVITLTGNGSFKFGKRLIITENYNVTVRNQPAGQQCVVTKGAGSVPDSSEDITDVSVICR